MNFLDGYEVFADLPDDNCGEVIVGAEITHYVPPRPAPACSNPSSPLYSDTGEPGECDYRLKGFIRIESAGDAEPFMIELTEDQLHAIESHYELELQTQDKADDLFVEVFSDIKNDHDLMRNGH